MTIVEELKKLIAKRGGSTSGIQTIAEAVKVLTKIEPEEEVENPQQQQEVG